MVLVLYSCKYNLGISNISVYTLEEKNRDDTIWIPEINTAHLGSA